MTASLPSQAALKLNERGYINSLDPGSGGNFDDLTNLAAYVCQAKIAILSLMESDRHRIVSKVGLGFREAFQCRDFFSHTLDRPNLLVVPDTLADKHFATYPAVTCDPKIRFYAGIPLVTAEGARVGTLSVMDREPRNLSWEQVQALKTIGRQIVAQKSLPSLLTHQRRKVINVKEMRPEIPWDIVEILESIGDAFLALDEQWRFSYLNSRAEQLLMGNKNELIGKCLWDEFPEAIGSTFEKECSRAILKQVTVHFEEFYSPLGIWLEVRAHPYKDGLFVYLRDVSARKQSEAMLMERSRLSAFGADIGIALAHGGALPEILNRCTQIVVDHLEVLNACIWTVNQETHQLQLQAIAFGGDIQGEVCVASTQDKCEIACTPATCDLIRPANTIVDFIVHSHQPYLSNNIKKGDPHGIEAWLEKIGQGESQNVKAFAAYPLIVEERTIGAISLASCQSFSEEAQGMLEWVANAIAVAIDRAWARSELLSRRESLLFRLASQIRNSLDLDTILDTAVHEIRSLLQIDRCHFVWCWPDPEHPSLTVTHEACHPDLPSLLADYPSEKVTSLVKKIQILETIRINDIDTISDLEAGEKALLNSLGVTSQLLIPLKTHSGQLGAVVCSHCSGARPWSDSEVELLKAVVDQLAIAIDQAELFAQTRAAAFAAQTQAQQLEGALQNLKQTEAQLVQTEKMSSLGQMVAGIAHEINNPINFIYGNVAHASNYIEDLLALLHLYEEFYPDPMPEIQELAEQIDLPFLSDDLPKLVSSMQAGTERIRQIVLSLRNFSRLDEAEKKPVNIHEGIDSTLLILQNRLKGNANHPEIQVIKEYGDLPLVECYAGQLNQVFMNVLSNAIDALENQPAPRTIEIRTEILAPPVGKDAELALPHFPEWIAIKIRDNGLGMTENVIKRLFDPFFTTKPVGKGTGLGLSISYQIVAEKHGGRLRCISAPGEGAEFIIEIPLNHYR